MEKIEEKNMEDITMEEERVFEARCVCCGQVGRYKMDDEEAQKFEEYQWRGRSMGMMQNLFPKVPARIRNGAIDQYSGGFCICPECSGF